MARVPGAGGRRQRWSISLGTLLLLTSLGVTLSSAALIGALAFTIGRHAIDDVAIEFGAEVNGRIRSRIESFLDAPRRINAAQAASLVRGFPDPRDQADLLLHFWEELQLFDSVNSIYFGNASGGLANAGREGAKGSQYLIATDGFVAGIFRKFATDGHGDRSALESSLPHFDARQRPWYSNAVAAGRAVWNPPYVLFTGQELAIAASQPVFDAAGRLIGVAAVDVFLSHLGDMLAQLKVGKTGQSFIMERSGFLIASSTGEDPFKEKSEGSGYERRRADGSSNQLTRLAAAAVVERLGAPGGPGIAAPALDFDFSAEGSRYFCQIGPFQDPAGLDWLVITVIPESEYIATIIADFRASSLLVILILALGLGINLVLVGRIVRPISELKAYATRLAEGQWAESARQPSAIRELDLLSGVFQSMATTIEATVSGLRHEVEERKGIQAALAIARDKAEEASRAKSEFLANISHELRTPLNAVTGYTDLLLRTSIDEEQRRQLLTIGAAGTLLSGIIGDILDFSRIGAGKLELEIRKVNLGNLVTELATAYRHVAAKKGLGFTLSLPELPGSVDLDAGRLRQVLANLLDNAVKFTASGQVDFNVRFVEDPDARGKLAFSVSDTGIGIPQDRMDRLLEPFSQIDGSKTRKFGGLGLGLFMSRLLVQKMGGSITITSEAGRGSKFEFEIGTVFHDGDYEDLAGLGPLPASAGEVPKPGSGTQARKASIPAAVAAKTREASRDGDIVQLEAIADELGQSDTEAAGTLRQLLETYDYAGIETWLSGMEGNDGN